MSKLPRVSGREVVRAFARIGYEVDRQRGSHVVLRHRDPPHRRLVVPDHREVAKGTLRKLIREACPFSEFDRPIPQARIPGFTVGASPEPVR